MPFRILSPTPGLQKITDGSSTQNHPVGTIIRAADDATNGQGHGEFIYLLGVVGTLTGMLVIYNVATGLTALLTVTNGRVKGAPVAVAMRANVAGQYGWYQITGLAVIRKTTVATLPQVPIFISATAGRMKTLASAGQMILGAQTANLTTIVSTTSTVTVLINRPVTQSQIT